MYKGIQPRVAVRCCFCWQQSFFPGKKLLTISKKSNQTKIVIDQPTTIRNKSVKSVVYPLHYVSSWVGRFKTAEWLIHPHLDFAFYRTVRSAKCDHKRSDFYDWTNSICEGYFGMVRCDTGQTEYCGTPLFEPLAFLTSEADMRPIVFIGYRGSDWFIELLTRP